ncbi:MAG: hypothetical protein KAH44_19660, partial [Oricola sp.]|nr:hypothetical protein [Oricola sp.]
MMAAASIIAASAALSPAGASDFDPAARPVIEAVGAPVAHAADHADEAPPAQKIGAKKWALLAAAAASLAGLLKLIGARKVATVVAESAVKTARAASRGASSAVKTVTRAVGAPFRFLALLLGLALF